MGLGQKMNRPIFVIIDGIEWQTNTTQSGKVRKKSISQKSIDS